MNYICIISFLKLVLPKENLPIHDTCLKRRKYFAKNEVI